MAYEWLNQMAQLKAQLQQILLGQQQLRHQQITMTQSNNGQVAVELEDRYWDTPAEVTSLVTDLTGTRLGGDLSLGGCPRLGRDQSPGRGPMLDGVLSLGRGPRLGGDLSLGGGPRPGRDQSPGRDLKLEGDQSLGRVPRNGEDQSLGKDQSLSGDKNN